MFKFNLSSVLKNQGTSIPIKETATIESVDTNKCQYKLTKPVELEGEFTNISDNEVNFKGILKTEFLLLCDRCMAEVHYPITINFHQKFDGNVVDDNDAVQDDDEVQKLNGNIVDLYPLVIEELKLSIPMKVLCKPDCKGLCSVCGANLNKKQCKCKTEDIDPRLAVLKDLLK